MRGVQIHWFSIFNSSMILIFLTGLVAMILMRTLRADYARYTARDEDDLEVLPKGPPTPQLGPACFSVSYGGAVQSCRRCQCICRCMSL